jgi:hypothetical protein
MVALRMILAAAFVGVLAMPAQAEPMVKQVYKKPGPIKRGSYADPYFGRQGNRICARWCLEDRNPCDPPEYKVADGRCYVDY